MLIRLASILNVMLSPFELLVIELLGLKVFGRGGEELDFLQQKGIQVKVIPGMILDISLVISIIVFILLPRHISWSHCG